MLESKGRPQAELLGDGSEIKDNLMIQRDTLPLPLLCHMKLLLTVDIDAIESFQPGGASDAANKIIHAQLELR